MLCVLGNTSEEIHFNTLGGQLIAKRNGDMITLDFPLNPAERMVILFIVLYS